MKKIIFIVVCVVSLGFSSCGSTSPCGLAKTDTIKQNQHQSEIIIADATEITE